MSGGRAAFSVARLFVSYLINPSLLVAARSVFKALNSVFCIRCRFQEWLFNPRHVLKQPGLVNYCVLCHQF